MAFATLQLTQGAIVGGSGESIAGLDVTTAIVMTDDGGAGANSYLWEVLSFPGPDSAAPTITNPTLQVATITPPGGGITDGMYVIRLTRDDPGDGVSTDVRFFAVENNDGHSLPSGAVNRNMANIGGSTAAQDAGWFGSAGASTNFFLDAFLRLRKLREGRYMGRVTASTHSSGSLTTVLFTYDTDDPFQEVTMAAAGTGNFQADLDLVAPTEEGAVFRFRVTFNALAGDFIVRNGTGGSTILTLNAPPSGAIDYDIEARNDGTNWVIKQVALVAPLALRTEREFLVVGGVQSTSEATFTRAGTVQIDPTLFPANAEATFEASFDTTDAGNAAEVRLFNVSDAVIVGSAFSTTSTTNVTSSAVVTLPGSLKDYEVQVRLTSMDAAERATVTRARIILTWA